MRNRERDPKIAQLMALPWTIRVTRDDDNGFVARIDELPETIATGDTGEAMEGDFWEALAASLRARIHFGAPIPVPKRRPRFLQAQPINVIRAADTITTAHSGSVALA